MNLQISHQFGQYFGQRAQTLKAAQFSIADGINNVNMRYKITKAKLSPWHLLKFPLQNLSHINYSTLLSRPNDALNSSLLLRETLS